MMGSEIRRSEAMDGSLMMQSQAYQLPQQRFHQAISGMYARAFRRGRWNQVIGRIFQRETGLIDLENVLENRDIRNSYESGLRTVPIDELRGSQGRMEDFDAALRPVKAHTRSRWMSVAAAWASGVVLPPVELVQVGAVYFIRDGHHRISVAKAFGQESIEASVIVIELV
jgi:hypothetical protein